MKIIKKKLKIAIDSPAAAGAGTLAKKISDHYNLYYLDTGKIYRYIAYLKIKYPKKFGNSFIKKQIKKLNIKKLKKKELVFISKEIYFVPNLSLWFDFEKIITLLTTLISFRYETIFSAPPPLSESII